MGKVLSVFTNGYPGSISRAVDDIVISIRNVGSAPIPFGAPVFMNSAGTGVTGFDTATPQAFAAFVGFAVRVADKTPDTYPGGPFDPAPAGAWQPGDVAEVLVRGAMAVTLSGGSKLGAQVYVRKSDGALTTTAGAEGTTLELTNVKVRHPRDNASGCAEILLTARNIQ